MLQNYAGFTCNTEIRVETTVNIAMFAGSEYSCDFYAYKIHFKEFFNSADNIRGNNINIPMLTGSKYSYRGLWIMITCTPVGGYPSTRLTVSQCKRTQDGSS
jgi:hypothetical protein